MRPKSKISRPVSYQAPHITSASFKAPNTIGDTGLKIGQRVHHKKFSEGIILNFEGSGTNWLMPSIAKLEVL